jgi:hypothetical protein
MEIPGVASVTGPPKFPNEKSARLVLALFISLDQFGNGGQHSADVCHRFTVCVAVALNQFSHTLNLVDKVVGVSAEDDRIILQIDFKGFTLTDTH